MSVGFVVGVLLGILFYGGLWITVRQLMITRHPIAVTLGSLILRLGLVLAGLLLVSRGRWQNVAACFVGLTAGRIVVGSLCT
jgi:F1F0 ATPase subunit 2